MSGLAFGLVLKQKQKNSIGNGLMACRTKLFFSGYSSEHTFLGISLKLFIKLAEWLLLGMLNLIKLCCLFVKHLITSLITSIGYMYIPFYSSDLAALE